jgi:hypothetical protein
MTDSWSVTSISLVSGLDVTALLLVLALYDSKRFWWAGRGVTGIIFLAYLLYLGDENLKRQAVAIRPSIRSNTVERIARIVVYRPSLSSLHACWPFRVEAWDGLAVSAMEVMLPKMRLPLTHMLKTVFIVLFVGLASTVQAQTGTITFYRPSDNGADWRKSRSTVTARMSPNCPTARS